MRKLCEMTEKESTDYLQLIAEMLHSVMPENQEGNGRCMFMLFVIDSMGEGSSMRYVGTANVGDFTKALREMAAGLEGNGNGKPT